MRPEYLYIHIPFCAQRCHYCDFASSAYDNNIAMNYLSALGQEFSRRASRLTPRTMYVGGGTPTSLSDDQLRIFLNMLEKIDRDNLIEFTVEANPGTLTIEKLSLLRDNGVTRISLGVQSWCNDGLKTLGRIHDSRQARFALALCREAGFDDVSVDLIYGWPGQTPSMWFDDLTETIRLAPTHISCYGLTYEDGTVLSRRRNEGSIQVVSEESEREMFDMLVPVLSRADYRRYEISAFARAGCHSRHNMAYWEGCDYVGLGAGAYSYEEGMRFANVRNAENYIRMMANNGSGRIWEERLSPERAAREYLVIGLRMTDGIDANRFQIDTGFCLEELLEEVLPNLLEQGWLEWRGSCLRLSDRALPVADTILAELVV